MGPLPGSAIKRLSVSGEVTAGQVSMTTRDGETLWGYWAFRDKNASTVICFHGNGESAEGTTAFWGNYFCSMGCNVLLAEYRGYGLSTGSAGGRNQELEAYLDAEAALKFVIEQGIKREKVIAFGTSLGGAYAVSLGYFFHVGTVIIDHSFTSPEAVAASKVRLLSEETLKEGLKVIYDQGRIEPDPDIGEKALVTDGFNSLEKVKNSHQTALFVIQGREDDLMPVRFGRRFMEEKYGDDPKKQKDCLAIVEGDHKLLSFFEQTLAARRAQVKLFNFLKDRGLFRSHAFKYLFLKKTN